MHWPQHMQNVMVSKQIFTKSKFNPCFYFLFNNGKQSRNMIGPGSSDGKNVTSQSSRRRKKIYMIPGLFLSIQQLMLWCVTFTPSPSQLCCVVLNYTEEERVERKECRRHTIHWNHNERNCVNLPTSLLLCFPFQTFPVPSPPTLFFFLLLSAR